MNQDIQERLKKIIDGRIPIEQGSYNDAMMLQAQTKDGKPIPIPGTAVIFSLVEEETETIIAKGTCEIVDWKQGLVRYQWKKPELDRPCICTAKLTVDLGQGVVRDSQTYRIIVFNVDEIEKIALA